MRGREQGGGDEERTEERGSARSVRESRSAARWKGRKWRQRRSWRWQRQMCRQSAFKSHKVQLTRREDSPQTCCRREVSPQTCCRLRTQLHFMPMYRRTQGRWPRWASMARRWLSRRHTAVCATLSRPAARRRRTSRCLHRVIFYRMRRLTRMRQGRLGVCPLVGRRRERHCCKRRCRKRLQTPRGVLQRRENVHIGVLCKVCPSTVLGA